MNSRDLQAVLDHSRQIGDILERNYPHDVHEHPIQAVHVDAIAHELTIVVAEILQSWLDAGSERDVTMEDLEGPIRAHVRSWT